MKKASDERQVHIGLLTLFFLMFNHKPCVFVVYSVIKLSNLSGLKRECWLCKLQTRMVYMLCTHSIHPLHVNDTVRGVSNASLSRCPTISRGCLVGTILQLMVAFRMGIHK